MKYIKLIILVSVCSFITSCYTDNEEELYPVADGSGEETCSEIISYKDDIYPIIMKNCAVTGCHKNIQSPIYSDYASIKAKADRINSRVGAGTMPPSGPISKTDAEKIACWVEQGALDN